MILRGSRPEDLLLRDEIAGIVDAPAQGPSVRAGRAPAAGRPRRPHPQTPGTGHPSPGPLRVRSRGVHRPGLRGRPLAGGTGGPDPSGGVRVLMKRAPVVSAGHRRRVGRGAGLPHPQADQHHCHPPGRGGADDDTVRGRRGAGSRFHDRRPTAPAVGRHGTTERHQHGGAVSVRPAVGDGDRGRAPASPTSRWRRSARRMDVRS